MCGIIGYFASPPPSDLQERLGAAITALHHRGPDDCGHELFAVAKGTLALGHTRLSIIDLSAAGHQPMHSADGRYTIVFNGEIYNYKELRQELGALGRSFHTDSDTEVLIACWAEWGEHCLQRLRGMFAFVVFDRKELTLSCVRDAFGIKPFFYQWDPHQFFFASEVPALRALLPQPPGLNVQCAYNYLVDGRYDDSAETFLAGVRQILPGHLLTLDLEKKSAPTMVRWWWPSVAERTDLSFVDAADQLRTMFLDNIRLHLRSDVPLGVALSGGVDSSAIVCAMRYVEPDMPIHTFSYVARGSDVDEEQWVDLVNTHVGAITHKMTISPKELAADMDDMIRAQGEPFGSTSIYAQYRVFKLAREHGITVMLDGQGADELLAGYSGYPVPRMRSMLEKGELLNLYRFLRNWPQWPGRSSSHCIRSCIGLLVPKELQSAVERLRRKEPPPEWLNLAVLKMAGVVMSPQGKFQLENDAVGRRLAATLRQSLIGQGLNSLLRHADRNSMRWSVESRVPFLTTDMAEFLLSLPEHYLISWHGETKHIFRAAMRDIVPDVILDRRDKIGFSTPEQVWLKQLEGQVMTSLHAADSLPFLKASACRHEVQEMINGKRPFSFQAWRLINYCRWAT